MTWWSTPMNYSDVENSARVKMLWWNNHHRMTSTLFRGNKCKHNQSKACGWYCLYPTGRRECLWQRTTPMTTAVSPAGRTRSWESPLSSCSRPNTQVSSWKRTQPFFHCQNTEYCVLTALAFSFSEWSTDILRLPSKLGLFLKIILTQRIHVTLMWLLKQKAERSIFMGFTN